MLEDKIFGSSKFLMKRVGKFNSRELVSKGEIQSLRKQRDLTGLRKKLPISSYEVSK